MAQLEAQIQNFDTQLEQLYSRIAEIKVAKLNNWFSGINLEIRQGSRLNNKYELKVYGLQDIDVQWLAKQNYSEISWDKPKYLLSENKDNLLSLLVNIDQSKVTKGMQVYCSQDKTEYVLDSWGNMRAEVINQKGDRCFKYLNQLEIIPNLSELMPVAI